MSVAIEDLLADLRRRDILLALDGENLAVDAPRGALQAGDIDQLRAQKPEILAFLRRVAGGDACSPIPRVDRCQPLRLSPAQARLWFGEQLGGVGSLNHLPGRISIEGPLDATALHAALDRIVERHESLRTRFVHTGDEVVQEVQPPSGFPLDYVDLHDLPEGIRSAQLEAHCRQEHEQGFALALGPLVRGRLLRLAPNRHVLLVTMHHIVADGWSLAVLARELGVLYSAFARSETDPLPILPIQYADYASWQHARCREPDVRAKIAWWVQQLAGAPALELPSDRRRPEVAGLHAGEVGVCLPQFLVDRLRGMARREDLTMFMVLHAAWTILLARLSGQDDVVVGVPAANRGRRELDGLIGFFVNTLALRTRVHPGARLCDFLAEVRDTVLEGFARQDAPFEQVVEALAPARDLGRSPVFQSVLALQNAPSAHAELDGLSLVLEAAESDRTAFDLALSLEDRDGALVGRLVYATELFDRETIERWAIHFAVLLEAMTGDREVLVGELPLLEACQRRELLEAFNPPAQDQAAETLVHALFEAQAARTPFAPAVESGNHRLSYGELNARANRLAHALRAHGVDPGAAVAVCAERSIELVVALLAIFKAGGVYVPLDPAYPAQRLAYLIEDSAPVLVLAQPHVLAALPESGVRVLSLHDEALLSGYPALDPIVRGLGARDLAYIIHTSGSTGQPKGVMVEHRQLAVTLQTAAEELRFGPDDVLPSLASHAFDISLLEMLLPLVRGGRTVLVPPAQVKDIGALVEATSQASYLHVVPSLMQVLLAYLESPGANRFERLRCVLVGGEAVPHDLLQRMQARWPGADVVELYGPTEATLVSSFYRDSESTLAAVTHNVGRPFDRARMYVLDGALALQPIGVVGEIHLGGDRVARGYCNLPQLSAERFVADPYSPVPGARMYRTGDLGRWRRDGNVEFLGRNDQQVKIRGFRIELGEVEAQLRRMPGVDDATVLASDDGAGGKRLVAYVVVSTGAPDVVELRDQLAMQLPAHMVPALFVHLPALPLTPNGKIDRAALPAPGADAVVRRAYAAPVGEIEQALAAIWQGLLGVERV
ncbi:amino acid adenylation domain-containing protein, partial [Cognatiluteimonas telluris]|uniref:non-ribosomal peptide synthetase n=1 Tax=Cognatiluteimonas telluris TaxID=1104775 RepID=UPI00140C4DA5